MDRSDRVAWRKIFPDGEIGPWRLLPVPDVVLEDVDRGWNKVEYATHSPPPPAEDPHRRTTMPNPPPIEYLSNIGDVFTCPKCDRIISPVERHELVDGVKYHVICPPPRTAKLLMMGHELPIVMRPDGRWELLPPAAVR